MTESLVPGAFERMDVKFLGGLAGEVRYAAYRTIGLPPIATTTCTWRDDRGTSDIRLVTFTGDKNPLDIAAGEVPTYKLFCFFW